jgi:lipid-binding SYLF domain-containing protein
VVIWSGRAAGLFAGLDISGSDIAADTAYDQSYYRANVGTRQIISGQIADTHGNANKLQSELPS